MRGFARVGFVAAIVTACCAVAAGSAAGAVGDFDPTFGSGGFALAQVGLASAASNTPTSTAYSMALMPDGKVVLAGQANDAAGKTAAGFARFTSAGVLDPSFGGLGNGTFVTQFGLTATPYSQIFLNGAVAQPDGRLIASGYATDGAGNYQVLVARFTAAGGLDPSFASGGRLLQQLGAGATPVSQGGALVLQPDGKILVAGNATDAAGHKQAFVERLTSGGAPDSSFGTGGVRFRQYGAGATPASEAIDIILQPDGSPVIVGDATESNGDPAALIARLTPSGQTDAGFGGGGKVVQLGLHTPSGNATQLVTVQPQQGNFVVSGIAYDSSAHSAFVLARFTSTGNLDSSFGTGGKTINQFSAGTTSVVSVPYAAITQPNGKLVLVGGAIDINDKAEIIVARYSANGALDPSFGTGGVVQGTLPGAALTGAAWLPDGKLLMGGEGPDGTNFQFLAARMIMDLPPTAAFTAGSATAGQPVTFDASSSGDSDGTIAQVSWNFGDGASGAGTTASHTYAQPGSYNVQATVTDDNGLTASTSKAITVSAPPLVTPAVTIPGLAGLKLAPAAFPAAPGGASIARTTGTTIRYTDSAAATTTFVVQRVLKGVKRGKSCVKPKAGARKGKSCTRFVTVAGSFTHADAAGANSFHFTGRIRGHKLAVGSYRLVAQPSNAAGLGKKSTAGFRIIR